ncbi:MAG: hypothetical protein COT67_02315 [Candidatus Tagabacteria bacterium CG09_land_8_20_14_0_10_41_14]|uniref:Fibronectin type-III domain-containing protein n=1 Tax=Candidatus Tagabacteria bacterium CG09_land_8_20_14_0_10_41_14 TaxID=1975021 RepID=A0A2H0WKX1_9BACT|nr:MAG: hypothetical protein COT67_02315 [Candidatus Tagabacteria bacterium CG09_land_8_20_14_0_10_41_14]
MLEKIFVLQYYKTMNAAKIIKIITPIFVISIITVFLIQPPESAIKLAKEKIDTAKTGVANLAAGLKKGPENNSAKNPPTDSQTANVYSGLSPEKEQKYISTIEALEQELNEWKSRDPEIKETIKTITKEVPVEKIVVKEIVIKEPCNYNIPIIKYVNAVPEANSAVIRWETDKLTKSEISIWGGGFAEPEIFPSAFPTATHHRVTITGLNPLTLYRYEIRAYTMKNGEILGESKETGAFSTDVEETEEE